jgi:hypothetical protein
VEFIIQEDVRRRTYNGGNFDFKNEAPPSSFPKGGFLGTKPHNTNDRGPIYRGE